MDLSKLLKETFMNWIPPAPEVTARSNNSITLDWRSREPFGFLSDKLLYRLEKREKIPPWAIVYSGGKTSKVIGNLTPRHPYKFRLKVILKASAVNSLEESAIEYFGGGEAVRNNMVEIGIINNREKFNENDKITYDNPESLRSEKESGGMSKQSNNSAAGRWLESQWSEEAWSSTDSAGTSALCFCMAVRCGYVKQLQAMLEERPELIDIAASNGVTPLATAIRKGDINIIRFLLLSGADVNLPLNTGQTPLHLAVLKGNLPVIDVLLDRQADFLARDVNALGVEHYAVDSCSQDVLKYIMDKGGDVTVQDNKGWTPLFRAVCQGAATEVIEELIHRGSTVDITDNSGLTLVAAARLLKDKNGCRRESVLRLVDTTFVHEKALTHFSRLTKKISSVQALFK